MNSLSGKILGKRYLLLDKIGEGGMAIVYKARCQLLNRFVAIKILKPEFVNDEEFVKKFKRESLAAASLSHPNIVSIYDVGQEDEIYYIVMEYVKGQTLKEYIKKKGKIDYIETLSIILQIAMALEHAHKNGIVHRDIKPHNILLTEDRIVKVTDFGIARVTSSSTATNFGNIMGSVHYFSPEQARGGFTDQRTDIYSLGVVMYEMLTGQLPYEADSPVTIALKHIQEDFIEPSVIDEKIPKAVNDIVIKCMKKNVTQRYQNAKDMINDINVAIKNPMIPIREISNESDETKVIPVEEIEKALKKPEKKLKKNKLLIPIVISFAIIVVIIISSIVTYKKYFTVNDVKVPSITGFTIDEAKDKLTSAKLKYTILEGKNSDKPKGTIIEVDPNEGTKVKEGSTVKLVESTGKKMVVVPDITKFDKNNADATLTRLGLKIGNVDSKPSNEIDKDLICDQNPKKDSEVDEGTAVNITISTGQEVKLSIVPYIVGKSLDDAKKLIVDSKLSVGNINEGFDIKYKDGMVIYQDVSAGNQVKEGSAISIKINKLVTPTP